MDGGASPPNYRDVRVVKEADLRPAAKARGFNPHSLYSS